jgi:hypothetical protein
MPQFYVMCTLPILFYLDLAEFLCLYNCSRMYLPRMLVRPALALVFFVITGNCLLVLRYWIIVMVQVRQLESCTEL